MRVGGVHGESGLTWNVVNKETLARQRARDSGKKMNGEHGVPMGE